MSLPWSVLVRVSTQQNSSWHASCTVQIVLSLCYGCRYTGHTLAKFIITMVSGVLTGVFAVALSSSVGALTEWKLHTIQSLLDGPGSHKIWMAFLWHWAYSCVLVVFAVALVSVQLPSSTPAHSPLRHKLPGHIAAVWLCWCMHAVLADTLAGILALLKLS
jgi:hypothetical protein